MPDRKKAVEILIIVIGGAYLLYRIFAPKTDMGQTTSGSGDAAGHISAGPEIAGLKEAAKNQAESDRGLKNEIANARDVFQKPDEFFTFEEKTESTAPPKTEENTLSLEGTIWGHGKNIAILSGAVVVEGDTIRGGKVIRIEPGKVVILKNGVESEIKRSP